MWAGVWQSILQELPKHGHGGDDRREKVYSLLGKKVQPEVSMILYTHIPHVHFFQIYEWWTVSGVVRIEIHD